MAHSNLFNNTFQSSGQAFATAATVTSQPLNFKSRIRYSRVFLLSLRNSRVSLQKPKGLPFGIAHLLPGSENTPAKGQKRADPRSRAAPKPAAKPLMSDACSSETGRQETQRTNAQQKKTDDLAEREVIAKCVQSIADRNSSENFESNFEQLIAKCNLVSERGLNACVDIVFEKVLTKKGNMTALVDICKRLAYIRAAPMRNQRGNLGDCFGHLLLRRCQGVFETPMNDQVEHMAAESGQKIAMETNTSKMQTMKVAMDAQLSNFKHKYYKNMRFMAQLYLEGVATADLICHCVETLLSRCSDTSSSQEMLTESALALYEMLKVAGKVLDSDAHFRSQMDQWFEGIRRLLDNKLMETDDARTSLMSLVEMRQRNWEPETQEALSSLL